MTRTTARIPVGPAAARRPDRSTGLIVAVLAIAGVVAAGTQTLIVPLIGRLPGILRSSPDDTAWAVTATLLASAATIPVAGRLGDMLGRRRILLASLVPLCLGSALCAASGTLGLLILGRCLQGLGMGVVPLGISLLREVVPPARVGAAVALMSASMGIGGAISLPFAATIAEYSSWRAMFAVFAALTALTFALVLWLVPSGGGRVRGARFDFGGAALLASALTCLLIPISKGASWGWTEARTLSLFAAAAFLLGFWILQQLGAPQPLVNLRSLRNRRVAITNTISLMIGFAMYGQSLIFPQLLQLPTGTGHGLGQSMVQMALWLVPGGIVMMLISPVGARITAAHGARTTLAVGATAIAAGYASSLPLLGSPWGIMVAFMAINVGVGLAYGAIPMLIMGAVPPAETGSANGFNTLVRSIGTSGASAVVGAVLATMSSTIEGHAIPTLAAFQIALVIGGGAAALAALCCAFLPGGRAVAPSGHAPRAGGD